MIVLLILIAIPIIATVLVLLVRRGRLQLIDDWRGAHKLLSMQVAAAVSWLMSWLADNSAPALTAWNTLPEELRGVVPDWGRIALGALIAFGAFAAARLLKQPVSKPPE